MFISYSKFYISNVYAAFFFLVKWFRTNILLDIIYKIQCLFNKFNIKYACLWGFFFVFFSSFVFSTVRYFYVNFLCQAVEQKPISPYWTSSFTTDFTISFPCFPHYTHRSCLFFSPFSVSSSRIRVSSGRVLQSGLPTIWTWL